MNQWVAIKIPVADSFSSPRERATLLELEKQAKNAKKPLKSFHITRLLTSFVHQGPNGSHTCLVFPLLGPSALNIVDDCSGAAEDKDRDYHDYLGPSTIWKMSEGLLKAVTFIHKCGFVHGGKNNLFKLFF